jgi:hypothetical protein
MLVGSVIFNDLSVETGPVLKTSQHYGPAFHDFYFYYVYWSRDVKQRFHSQTYLS